MTLMWLYFDISFLLYISHYTIKNKGVKGLFLSNGKEKNIILVQYKAIFDSLKNFAQGH